MSAAREAAAERGPQGATPRDCGEADAWMHRRAVQDKEAEA